MEQSSEVTVTVGGISVHAKSKSSSKRSKTTDNSDQELTNKALEACVAHGSKIGTTFAGMEYVQKLVKEFEMRTNLLEAIGRNFNKKYDSLKLERDKLKEELEATRDKNDDSSDWKEAARQRVLVLTAKLDKLEDDNKKLRGYVCSLERVEYDIRKKYAELNESFVSRGAQLDLLWASNKAAADLEWSNRLSDVIRVNEELKSQITVMQGRDTGFRLEIDRLNKDNAALREEAENMQQEVDFLAGSSTRWSDLHTDAVKRGIQLQRQLTRLKNESINWKKEKKQTKKEAGSAERLIAKLRVSNPIAFDELVSRFEKLERDIRTWRVHDRAEAKRKKSQAHGWR